MHATTIQQAMPLIWKARELWMAKEFDASVAGASVAGVAVLAIRRSSRGYQQ